MPKALLHIVLVLFACICAPCTHAADATKAIGKQALEFKLQDQYQRTWTWSKHWQGKPVVIVLADWKASSYLEQWTLPLTKRLAERTQFVALADVSLAPSFLQDFLREKFRENYKNSILLDWDGSVFEHYCVQPGLPNLVFVDATGKVRLHTWGVGKPTHVDAFAVEVEKLCP